MTGNHQSLSQGLQRRVEDLHRDNGGINRAFWRTDACHRIQKCLVLGKNIIGLDVPPFTVYPKEKPEEATTLNNKQELLAYMLEEGRKNIGIQRYKGLGEMNPEQLWETTMNPEKRTLLQVKIKDIVDTDEIFTVLMGEEVEPRRDFIYNNALEVGTLDI